MKLRTWRCNCLELATPQDQRKHGKPIGRVQRKCWVALVCLNVVSHILPGSPKTSDKGGAWGQAFGKGQASKHGRDQGRAQVFGKGQVFDMCVLTLHHSVIMFLRALFLLCFCGAAPCGRPHEQRNSSGAEGRPASTGGLRKKERADNKKRTRRRPRLSLSGYAMKKLLKQQKRRRNKETCELITMQIVQQV